MLGSEVTRRWGGDGSARWHDRPHAARLGRAELRCVRAPRHHAAARGRRQRLRRQGPVRRADRCLPRSGCEVPGRAERDRRQRHRLRRDRRRDLHPWRGRRALLRAELGRHGRGGRRRRPWLRVHDGRAGRGARRDRSELRRRDVGRRRLRLRPERDVPRPRQPRDGSARAARRQRPRLPARDRRASRRAHRLGRRPPAARRLVDRVVPLPQGDAGGLQASARRDAAGRVGGSVGGGDPRADHGDELMGDAERHPGGRAAEERAHG